MPVPLRERVLAAFFAVIEAIPELATVVRNPTWAVEAPEQASLPAAGVFDGAEQTEDQNSRDMLVRTNSAIEVWTICPTYAEALADLNDKLGLIRQAVADNQTLGGLTTRIRYLGCDEPQVTGLEGSQCEASLELNFELERFEQHDNPYA